MVFLSFFSSRRTWAAPFLCLMLAIPGVNAVAQDSIESITSGANSAKKSSASAQQKPKASTASSTPSSTTKKKTETAAKPAAPAKKTTQAAKTPSTATSKSAAVKPSTAPRAHNTSAAPAKTASYAALRSNVVYVQDLSSNAVLYSRNDDVARPIASITKLMTAVVLVDANLNMNEIIEVTQDDVDVVKHSRSRLSVGTRLSRADMLHLALMSSENRAASALGRTYPGGTAAFVGAMNAKSQELGMSRSQFVEPTGLSSSNVSTPRDLVKLMQAAASRPTIHRYTTDDQYEVRTSGRTTVFRNTNALVTKPDWDIKVSKTGYINEAGQCLVMVARINNRDTAIVLLNAEGKFTRIGDAVRIRQMVQRQEVASIAPNLL